MAGLNRYLIKVDADENNNKFYKVTDKGDGTALAEWGRVGAPGKPQSKIYSVGEMESKLREKRRKGYVDHTEINTLVDATNTGKVDYKEIPDAVVRQLITNLMSYMDTNLKQNYMVIHSEVTEAKINAAQNVINHMYEDMPYLSIREFNDYLIKLFGILPRRMPKVANYLAHGSSVREFDSIIAREQDTLDVMKGRVRTNIVLDNKDVSMKDKTILEALGVDVYSATPEQVEETRKLLGSLSGNMKRVYRVCNRKMQEQFDVLKESYKAIYGSDFKIKRLWHGSRNENWFRILTQGLSVNPTNVVITGKMFGNGIYFAPEAMKSKGYTSLRGAKWVGGTASTGYMSVYDVLYGKPYHPTSSDSSIKFSNLSKFGVNVDVVHARKQDTSLLNDEIVIYRSSQCAMRYLVELQS